MGKYAETYWEVMASARDLVYSSLNWGTDDLTALALSFRFCAALQSLNLDQNEISTLPASIFASLASLEELTLRTSKVSELQSGCFDGLLALQVLDLQYNRITTLPAGVFSSLASLECLYLDHNKISVLPPGIFAACSCLRELTVGWNQIQKPEAAVPYVRTPEDAPDGGHLYRGSREYPLCGAFLMGHEDSEENLQLFLKVL